MTMMMMMLMHGTVVVQVHSGPCWKWWCGIHATGRLAL